MLATVNDYTSNLPDDDFDVLSAMIECAEYSIGLDPEIVAERKARVRAQNRIAQYKYRRLRPYAVKGRSFLVRPKFGRLSYPEIALQLKTQKGNCWWCGKECSSDYHVDHRIPLSKGGKNTAGNMVISCPTCNFKKGNKLFFNGRLL